MNISIYLLVGGIVALMALAVIPALLIVCFFIKAGKHSLALTNATERFSTSLNVAECLERIRSLTYPERSLAETTIVADIQGPRFLLHKVGTYGLKAGMGRAFHGEVVAAHDGAAIRGVFRMHPSYRWFWTCFFVGGIVVGGPLLLVSVAELLGLHFVALQGAPWVVAAGVPFLLGGGAAFFWLGRTVSKVYEREILTFITSSLDAVPVVESRPQ